MKNGLLMRVIDRGDHRFAFVELQNEDSGKIETAFVSPSICAMNGITTTDQGRSVLVAVSYLSVQEGRDPQVVRIEFTEKQNTISNAFTENLIDKTDPPKPEPEPEHAFDFEEEIKEDQVVTGEPLYDLDLVEMSLQGIGTAITGLEVSMTSHQRDKYRDYLDQLHACASTLEKELNADERSGQS